MNAILVIKNEPFVLLQSGLAGVTIRCHNVLPTEVITRILATFLNQQTKSSIIFYTIKTN